MYSSCIHLQRDWKMGDEHKDSDLGEQTMRYGFHGKKRGTLEEIDGYIDANSAIDAIDQLADEGIIGVQTVRQIHPRKPNAISFVGDFEEAVEASAGTNEPASEAVLNQLVVKMASLVSEVEKILSRPSVPAPAPLPARPNRIRVSEIKQPQRFDEQQDSVLKDIFQSNLDLRRSYEKQTSATPAAPAGTIGASSQTDSAPTGQFAVAATSAA
jgi:hypothetical protein